MQQCRSDSTTTLLLLLNLELENLRVFSSILGSLSSSRGFYDSLYNFMPCVTTVLEIMKHLH